jgi:hypothetical protein
MRRRRTPEIIAGRIGANGEIISGDNFNCVKNSTGSYSILFPQGFNVQSFTAIKINADSPSYVSAVGDYYVTWVSVSAPAAGGLDVAFMFIAVGLQK